MLVELHEYHIIERWYLSNCTVCESWPYEKAKL